jgi:4-amino-4-deoxy-L-arabinose transferase-like glycosyltransferase
MMQTKKLSPDRALSQTRFLWAVGGLVVLGLFLMMGVQPLFLEEPRRSFIAIEMLYNGNWWVPTQLGQLYYNKPPIFNWVLILSASLFGGFSEWTMRLPTVLSTIAIALLIVFMSKRYWSLQKGLETGLLSITSAGIFFYFSTLAEIDLFYSLVTLGMFFAIFHFDQIKNPFALFLTVYLLTAIGFLTKALPSLAFTALSLLSYFIYTKQFKRLFSLAHFTGIGLFLLISIGYYYQYAQFEDPAPFLTRLWGESSNRTVAGSGLGAFLNHLWQFPLNTLVDLLPGGILIIFLFGKKGQSLLQSNEFVRYCFWIAAVNFLLYWISPGSRQRYIYMLYPLFMVVLVQAYYLTENARHWAHRFFRIFLIVLCGLLAVGALALNFIPDLDFLPYRLGLSIVGLLAFSSLCFFFIRKKIPPLATLILATALARIVFDLAILPQRAHDSDAQKARDIAIQIDELVQEEELYLYWPHQKTIINEYDISFITVYYLDVLREQPLVYQDNRQEKGLFIAKKADINGAHELLLEFEQRGHQFGLVRFK